MRLLTILLCILLLAACDNKPSTDAPQGISLAAESSLPRNLTIIMAQAVNSYIDLKNGLADTNPDQSVKAANSMTAKLTALKSGLQADSADTDLAGITDKLLISLNKLSAIKDASCELQRIEFAETSALLYLLVSKTKLSKILLYYDYCPMALNNNGAYWLSESPEIKNPYFGSKMIECGEITNIIK